MSIRREQLVNNEIYHIVQRRIGNELIFKDINDYYRGIFSIYEFNNIKPVEIWKRRREINLTKKKIRETIEAKGGRRTSPYISDERDKLVEILAFCFMPNHIHLLLKQVKDEGITKFMRKVGTGYAKYFKERYDLKGTGYFFQGRFVSVPIKDDNQLKIVFIYIHTNPISLIEPKWKEIGIKEPDKAIKFIEDFKWSSYQDCIGKKNFPSVIEKEFMLREMGGEEECKRFVDDWIKHKGRIKDFSEIALE